MIGCTNETKIIFPEIDRTHPDYTLITRDTLRVESYSMSNDACEFAEWLCEGWIPKRYNMWETRIPEEGWYKQEIKTTAELYEQFKEEKP